MLPSHSLLTDSDWDARLAAADVLAAPCRLCPRVCAVDRRAGKTGFCGAPAELVISSIFPHHGEEPPISGTGGSGTVFFSHCTLGCCFCQNFQISHGGEGRPYSVDELADRMLWLQEQGCHNVNLVTPDHFVPWILRAIRVASTRGLEIPIVYNCSGYETVEALALLRGIVDIYLPDMKYGAGGPAQELSRAADYVTHNQAAVREMFRQVGPLRTDRNGIATRGMLIRHLVLPEDRAGSEVVAGFLSRTFDPADITIGVMAQYRPLHRALEHGGMARQVTPDEYERACRPFEDAGFNVLVQELPRLNEAYVIDFAERKHERLREAEP